MTKRARRNHSSAFQAKVAMAAIKGDRTIAHIAERFDAHPNQVTAWKQQLESGAAGDFGVGATGSQEPAVDVKALYAKTGKLTLEHNFFRRCAHQAGVAERVALKARLRHNEMIDREHALPVTKQAEAVGIARRTVLLPAASGLGRRPRSHAGDRPAAPGFPFRLRRAAAAECEIRGGLSAYLRERRRGADRARTLFRYLQSLPPDFEP